LKKWSEKKKKKGKKMAIERRLQRVEQMPIKLGLWSNRGHFINVTGWILE
jgi:hypothetical protein